MNFNYRLNAFGFLGGKESLAGGAANIGLYDRECRLSQQAFMASDRCSYRFLWARQPMIHGFDRKVLLGLGQDLYLQVRWRPKPGYCVSLIQQIRCTAANHSHRALRKAGVRAQGQSQSALTSSPTLRTLPSRPLLWYALPSPKIHSGTANSPTQFVAFQLCGYSLQDR